MDAWRAAVPVPRLTRPSGGHGGDTDTRGNSLLQSFDYATRASPRFPQMTDDQLRALIMAIISIEPTHRDSDVGALALEADEMIQHAREPFFPEEPDAER
jgi:hypothetical protein